MNRTSFDAFNTAMAFAANVDDIRFADERSGFIVEPINEPVIIESSPYIDAIDPVEAMGTDIVLA